MKNQVLFAVLAVFVAHVSCAAIELETAAQPIQVIGSLGDVEVTSISGRNLISGIISAGDRVLYRGFHNKLAGTATAIQTEDIVYRAALTTTRITYISALAVGATSVATTHIVSGGVNTNAVTLRLTSAPGQGYEFWVEIWGR